MHTVCPTVSTTVLSICPTPLPLLSVCRTPLPLLSVCPTPLPLLSVSSTPLPPYFLFVLPLYYCVVSVCSIRAGCAALPPLLNIKQVMQQRQCSGVWSAKDELPVSQLIHSYSTSDASVHLAHFKPGLLTFRSVVR